MKQLLVLCVLFFMLGIFSTTFAQVTKPTLRKINLNQKLDSLASPSVMVLSPGDTLQFLVEKGDFDILIRGAYKFLQIQDDDLRLRLDSSSSAQSKKYVVRKISNYLETTYSLYCISNNIWPAAPPRIIIKVQ